MSRLSLFPASLLLAAVAIALTGCTANLADGPDDAGGGDGDGDGAIVCESREDCPDPANYECQGVCLQLCASDDVCPADQYCSDGFCRTGCRAGTCAGEQICVSGSCIDRDAAETCGTKCDCQPGQVCNDGICGDPPQECSSSDDCGRGPGDECSAYACNGFTKQCFYPNAPDCSEDADCDFRPGCDEGCACAPSGLCISSAACTTETEADDCGPGAYCTMDLTCEATPTCTQDADCAAIDMICNQVTSQCERPSPCASDADCTQAPATYCDMATPPARCAIPTCMNGGVMCEADETCNPGTGACQPNVMGGDTCVSNADCSNAAWPATEYCNVPFGATEGSCTSGCQNNLSCPQGQNCNGAHQCVSASGGDGDMGGPGSAGSSCAAIEDCQAGLVCHLIEGTCQETCGASDSPCDPATDSSCCSLTGSSTCSPGFIFSFCG